jgi:hypothetical protein
MEQNAPPKLGGLLPPILHGYHLHTRRRENLKYRMICFIGSDARAGNEPASLYRAHGEDEAWPRSTAQPEIKPASVPPRLPLQLHVTRGIRNESKQDKIWRWRDTKKTDDFKCKSEGVGPGNDIYIFEGNNNRCHLVSYGWSSMHYATERNVTYTKDRKLPALVNVID